METVVDKVRKLQQKMQAHPSAYAAYFDSEEEFGLFQSTLWLFNMSICVKIDTTQPIELPKNTARKLLDFPYTFGLYNDTEAFLITTGQSTIRMSKVDCSKLKLQISSVTWKDIHSHIGEKNSSELIVFSVRALAIMYAVIANVCEEEFGILDATLNEALERNKELEKQLKSQTEPGIKEAKAALEEQVASLKAENAELKRQLQDLRSQPAK